MIIDTPYYEDHERVSNSSIGWFLKGGPSYFYKMLKGEIEGEKTQALERGTMIHSYLLTPEEFQKDYVIWDKSRPTSAQQEKFCQAYASSLEIEPNKAVLEAYKAAYSTKGKTEETMLSEGSKIASTLKDYIDYLKSGDQRIMIGPYDYQMLKKIRNNFEAHKLAWKLLSPDGKYGTYSYEMMPNYFKEDPTRASEYEILTWHEFHINWEYLFDTFKSNKHTSDNVISISIKCKSLLDSLTLDFKNKKVTIMDLKTTAKLWHFEESIEMYDYGRQLAYYKNAVWWYLKNECNEDPNNWSFKFYIIGIDTTGSNEIRVFEIPEALIIERDKVIFSAMLEIGWHQMNNKWDHSREYYEGDGSETLNI